MTRIAVIEKEKCNPVGCGDFLCIKLCPINRAGADCIIKGSDKKPIIDEALCTGCGICQNRCPFDAISIINLPEELEEEPIHRYGKNGFALYSLPSPVFGKVTGIIGKNGIGKSTAIKILAGVLKPNLNKRKDGVADEGASYDELAKFFKGTEKQNFFEKARDSKITVAYKPQNVDLIPKQAKGTVRGLLKRTDERGQFDSIVAVLGLTKFLDTDISKVSGGELQRIAIAATVLKKANLYIFDEPTSFLDIKQRLIVSKFIRSLADEKTSVVVIEHDLVALDYMADIINIMYGKPGSFGVVSQPRPAKAGVNTYLDGFLKEENMRIRDKPVRFNIKPPFEHRHPKKLMDWPGFTKTLGRFKLDAEPGAVHKQEIIGVVGENGIGKTAFVKVLAGIEKISKEIDTVPISYKPQYIDSGSEDLVMDVLREANERYSSDLIGPLDLKPLMLKKINELSGGELQRVAIAEALGKKADLVLLDEPSAYLDVEQRLIMSKIISSFSAVREKSVLVVDHDLVFIDYVSDRIMMFDGSPAEAGHANAPGGMEEGMNSLLKEVDITLRREEHTGRPRINKLGSVKDREQKSKGKYYYA